jgi:predicted metal-dependent enzyme (double-stranded beta helix superfamily)
VNQAILSAHLENAQNYVTKGEQYIGRLREIIDLLTQNGSDATDATGLLRQIQAVQEMYVSHRDWLQEELKRSTGVTYRGPS